LLREKKREGRGFYRREKVGLKKSEESGPRIFFGQGKVVLETGF